jgi:glutamine synthetase
MSLGFVNTVLNTIVAESIDELTKQLEKELKAAKGDLGVAVPAVVRGVWESDSAIIFNGDGYSEEWHAEAKERGLYNLPTTPDALPWIVNKQTVKAFEAYNVLSSRELESRYDVFVEQYATKLNIEAETAASMARTLILPAAVRHLTELKASGVAGLAEEVEPLVEDLYAAILALEQANDHEGPDGGIKHAKYMRDTVIPAMTAVRTVADKLERIVADDLWPLPKYSEMLFIK